MNAAMAFGKASKQGISASQRHVPPRHGKRSPQVASPADSSNTDPNDPPGGDRTAENGPSESAEVVVDRLPVELVPVRSLDGGDTPRLSGADREHVRNLAQVEGELPPILVHRPTMRVIDGMHRLAAARLRGDLEIKARFFDGDEESAFVVGVQLNVTHGLPLTLADRTAAATRILRHHARWSDRAIARAAGLAGATVGVIRRRSTAQSEQSNERVGLDGEVRRLNTAGARRLAGELIGEEPDTPLREIARRASISPATAHDVRNRLSRGQDPVPPKQREAEAGDDEAEASSECAAEPRPGAGEGHADAVKTQVQVPREPMEILERLRKDPSLRFSASGRALLQMFAASAVGTGKLPEAFDRLPPHCTGLVIEFIRSMAQDWDALADELEER